MQEVLLERIFLFFLLILSISQNHKESAQWLFLYQQRFVLSLVNFINLELCTNFEKVVAIAILNYDKLYTL